MITLLTGVLCDIRRHMLRGDVETAVNLVRNWAIPGGWEKVLDAREVEALKQAGWEGDGDA